MKVAKEEIVGMVAPADWFLSQSDEEFEAEFRRRADRIASALKDIPTLKSEIFIPPIANNVPHLFFVMTSSVSRFLPKKSRSKCTRALQVSRLSAETRGGWI
jgi:L-seryl-tRNA(Ser) seleniumtransferase